MGREVRRVPADWKHPKKWYVGMSGVEAMTELGGEDESEEE